jgi:endonuclease/exonuclease/phosphatase family metal-dependent hydrolase
MSFNIRYGAADDGANSWTFRRDLVFQAISLHQPAIFGVQECLWDQGVELGAAFPDYRMAGVGRDDGNMVGEMCAIFTRNDRYKVIEQGFFWLSETPEVVGSKGWDAALPRIASWVCLQGRSCDPDTLFVFNTHFDHVGALAREKSSRLLRIRMASIAGCHPVILMGDFNDPASPGSLSYRELTSDDGETGLVLRDTWFHASREQRMLGEGTFHGFSGKTSRGRIDWILATDHFQGVDAGIERLQDNKRYPSDHYPIWVTFRLERRPGFK